MSNTPVQHVHVMKFSDYYSFLVLSYKSHFKTTLPQLPSSSEDSILVFAMEFHSAVVTSQIAPKLYIKLRLS